MNDIPEKWFELLTNPTFPDYRLLSGMRFNHIPIVDWAIAYHFSTAPCFLLYKHNNVSRPSAKEVEEAINTYIRGKKMPENWFVFDRAFLIAAYRYGEKKHGKKWLTTASAHQVDRVIHNTFFGEGKNP